MLEQTSHAQLNGWHVLTASYRVLISRTDNPPGPAPVGFVSVWPVGVDPKTCAITIFADNGAPVGTKVLWAAAGQPLKLLFDTSGHATNYLVYLSAQPLAFVPQWKMPDLGLVLETRRRPDGPLDTAGQIKTLWKTATTVCGRGLVPRIFEGLNPFGPSDDFVAYYRGVFVVPQNGEYHFATDSDDGSVLAVDGRDVCDWPGGHGADARAYVEHSGKINLNAGQHTIEYYLVQGGGPSAAVAAWKPPGATGYEVMPESAFLPVERFKIVTAEGAPYFEWHAAEHAMIDDRAFVDTRFAVVSPKSNMTYRWTFDDGGTATGAEVTHTFLRPAIRPVRLNALTQEVDVCPNWTQMVDWPDGVFARQSREIQKRDTGKLPVADLAYAVRLAKAADDEDLLTYLGRGCLRRTREFKDGDVEVFLLLGAHFQSADIRDYERAEQCLRVAPGERGKLKLASFLLNVTGNADEAGKLCDAIKPDGLDDEERRQLALLRGDVLLARGDVEGARAKYQAVGELEGRALLRPARLETARDYLRRGEFDGAEEMVRSVEWQWPLERLAPESGALLVKVYMARKEWPRALARCQRLLPVAVNDNFQAELLFDMMKIQRALGLPQAAAGTLARLLKEHPYSEAAARAKELKK